MGKFLNIPTKDVTDKRIIPNFILVLNFFDASAAAFSNFVFFSADEPHKFPE